MIEQIAIPQVGGIRHLRLWDTGSGTYSVEVRYWAAPEYPMQDVRYDSLDLSEAMDVISAEVWGVDYEPMGGWPAIP